jgi:hypothetical protein
VTFEDPTTFTRPWTALAHLAHSDEKLYEVACHEGNLPVVKGILDGARAKEHAVGRSQEK